MPRAAQSISLDIVPGTAATVYVNSNLGTTPVQYPDASSAAFAKIHRFLITNKHASNHVGAALSATSTSPTFAVGAAGAVGAGAQFVVFPESHFFLNVPSSLSLWLVASAGSTPVICMSFDSNLA